MDASEKARRDMEVLELGGSPTAANDQVAQQEAVALDGSQGSPMGRALSPQPQRAGNYNTTVSVEVDVLSRSAPSAFQRAVQLSQVRSYASAPAAAPAVMRNASPMSMWSQTLGATPSPPGPVGYGVAQQGLVTHNFAHAVIASVQQQRAQSPTPLQGLMSQTNQQVPARQSAPHVRPISPNRNLPLSTRAVLALRGNLQSSGSVSSELHSGSSVSSERHSMPAIGSVSSERHSLPARSGKKGLELPGSPQKPRLQSAPVQVPVEQVMPAPKTISNVSQDVSQDGSLSASLEEVSSEDQHVSRTIAELQKRDQIIANSITEDMEDEPALSPARSERLSPATLDSPLTDPIAEPSSFSLEVDVTSKTEIDTFVMTEVIEVVSVDVSCGSHANSEGQSSPTPSWGKVIDRTADIQLRGDEIRGASRRDDGDANTPDRLNRSDGSLSSLDLRGALDARSAAGCAPSATAKVSNCPGNFDQFGLVQERNSSPPSTQRERFDSNDIYASILEERASMPALPPQDRSISGPLGQKMPSFHKAEVAASLLVPGMSPKHSLTCGDNPIFPKHGNRSSGSIQKMCERQSQEHELLLLLALRSWWAVGRGLALARVVRLVQVQEDVLRENETRLELCQSFLAWRKEVLEMSKERLSAKKPSLASLASDVFKIKELESSKSFSDQNLERLVVLFQGLSAPLPAMALQAILKMWLHLVVDAKTVATANRRAVARAEAHHRHLVASHQRRHARMVFVAWCHGVMWDRWREQASHAASERFKGFFVQRLRRAQHIGVRWMTACRQGLTLNTFLAWKHCQIHGKSRCSAAQLLGNKSARHRSRVLASQSIAILRWAVAASESKRRARVIGCEGLFRTAFVQAECTLAQTALHAWFLWRLQAERSHRSNGKSADSTPPDVPRLRPDELRWQSGGFDVPVLGGGRERNRSGAAFRVLRQLVGELVTTAETLPRFSAQRDGSRLDDSD